MPKAALVLFILVLCLRVEMTRVALFLMFFLDPETPGDKIHSSREELPGPMSLSAPYPGQAGLGKPGRQK